MNHFSTDNTLTTVRSKLALNSWLLQSFISSFPPLSYISPRYKKPMGGYHPEELLHGHLMCLSLSNHALTGDSRPKIRRPGRAHTSLPTCCFFRCPSKYNCHLLASSLDSPYTIHLLRIYACFGRCSLPRAPLITGNVCPS